VSIKVIIRVGDFYWFPTRKTVHVTKSLAECTPIHHEHEPYACSVSERSSALPSIIHLYLLMKVFLKIAELEMLEQKFECVRDERRRFG
jgi:hypothetical protein